MPGPSAGEPGLAPDGNKEDIMQTGTPIAQFALLREIEVKSEDEREITLREVSGAREAEPGLHDLSMQARESWPGSWSLTSIRVTPVFPAPWGEAPDSEEEYWRRVDAMVARARSAGRCWRRWRC